MLLTLLLPLLAHAIEPLPVLAPAPKATKAAINPETQCERAKKKLRLFALSYRVFCSRDDDCEAYSLSSDPCTPATVLRKTREIAEDKDLQALQAKESEACAAIWAKQSSCSPMKPRPVCRENKCVSGSPLAGSGN